MQLAAAERRHTSIGVDAAQSDDALATLGEPGGAAIIDDGRTDREPGVAILQDAERAAAGTAGQRTICDRLIGRAHRRRDDDGAVDTERLVGGDVHHRVRRRGVFQAAKHRAASDRAEKGRVGSTADVADHFAGQPVRRVVLVAVVGRREGHNVAAVHLGVIGSIDRRPAAEAGAGRGEAAARRQGEVDQAAGAGDRSEIDGHGSAGARRRGDPVAAGRDVQAVEALAAGRSVSASDGELASGHVQCRSRCNDVARWRARCREIEREPAAVQRRIARIGVGAAQRQRPHSRLHEIAAAGDAAGIARVVPGIDC